MKLKKEISPKTISVVFAVFVCLFVLGFYVIAWEEPDTAPPGGNVYAPLNTGDSDQYKEGRLGAYTNETDLSYGLTVGAAGMEKGIKTTGDSWFDGDITATGQICDSTGCIGGLGGSLWSQNGTKIYYNDGNVGIGTTDPDSKLEVETADGGKIHIDSSGSGYFDIDRASNTYASRLRFQTAGTDAFEVGLKGTSDNFHITDGSANSLVTINGSTGNVGIGTTGPIDKLHIYESATTGSSPISLLALEISDDGVNIEAGEGPAIEFYTADENDSDGAGNSASGAKIAAIRETTSDISTITSLAFYTAPDGAGVDERMRITGTGNVGIGTTNPSQKLDINGNIRVGSRYLYLGDTQYLYGDNSSALYWTNNHDSVTQMIFRDKQSTIYGRVYGSGNGSNFGFLDGDGNWSVLIRKDNSIEFRVDNNAEMRIYPDRVDFYNNKLSNVSEIDPLFGIDGKKYTTYMPDMIGQKIEVVGEAELGGDELVIDLDKQEEGSDLWLFWQTVARDTIIPFISPQTNAELYGYIDGSNFIIRSRQGGENAKFSYRLIGTRLDHKDDVDNLYDDQSVEHFIDIDALRK